MSGCTGDTAPWIFGSVALLLSAAGGLGVGWLLASQRQSRALHTSRQAARLTADLAGGRLWQTDAEHRLLGGLPGAEGQPIWELFEAGAPDAVALRQALERQGGVAGLPLRRAGDASPCEWHALPRYDTQGRFEGHLGLTRPLDTAGPGLAALSALARHSSGPVFVAVRHAAETGWRVLHANPAAQQAFGAEPSVSAERIAAALPAGLRAAWVAGDAAGQDDGWHFERVSTGPQTTCVVWQTRSGPTDEAAEQTAFSYTVSHDLRAPIRVVEGFTRIVKEDYGPGLDRVANDHLDRVLGAAARMNQMIDAMLTLARLSTQPLTRQPVNLSQLAGYVLDDLRRAAPEREAQLRIEAGLQVQGDPTLLRQVLENLLGNAWKYTSRRAQTQIEFGTTSVDGRTVYTVRDNGDGFDMQSSDRLFGLFQRLHSAKDFPGTGIGLASVRRIVRRHGGSIWADGEPGRGAAFHFTLND